jgi:hypothetical protein
MGWVEVTPSMEPTRYSEKTATSAVMNVRPSSEEPNPSDDGADCHRGNNTRATQVSKRARGRFDDMYDSFGGYPGYYEY